MKNKLIIGTILTGMLFMTTPVEAMGNAKVEFLTNDNVQVGDTFTVSMSVTDIKDTYDGIVSMGGNLSFDSEMVEYVSSRGIETPYLFQMNEDYHYKIAGLDFTLDNGIRDTLTVYEFTFKALKEGNTIITLTNAKLTDSQSYVDTVVVAKEIAIYEKQETIISEVPVIEAKEEVFKQETSMVIETKPIKNNTEVKEELEVIETEEDIIEENPMNSTDISEEQETLTKEKETFSQRIRKVFNKIFTKLRNLFK